MYNELKAKCEQMIDELMIVRRDCLVGDTSAIRDPQHGNLLHRIDHAANNLASIINMVNAFFSEE